MRRAVPGLALVGILVLIWAVFGVEHGGESSSAEPRLRTIILPHDDFPVGSVTLMKDQNLFLARVSPVDFRALYWRDPHSGCVLRWSPSELPGKLHDPCTGSIYGLDGRKLAGPSPRNLDEFPTVSVDGEVRVDPGTLVLGEVVVEFVDEGPVEPREWNLSISEAEAVRRVSAGSKAAGTDGYEVRRVNLVSAAVLRRMVRDGGYLAGLEDVELRGLPDEDVPLWIIGFDPKDVPESSTPRDFDRWAIVDSRYGVVLGSSASR